MKEGLNINSEILAWSIQRAGWNLDEFISKYPNYQKWIDGKKKPSIKQLEDFSGKLQIPFGYLFLQSPPEERNPIAFFRTDKDNHSNISPNVRDMILLLQKRQDWLRDYLKENHREELPFVGKFSNKKDIFRIVADIRKTLGLQENWYSQLKNWEETLKFLIQKIEDIGIIIIFSGIYENNTKRTIPLEECRGCVLVDKHAPFLFINSIDSKSSQLFTIIHELAHIWIGASAGFDFKTMLPANDPIEKVCDKVAAEFLVPEAEFQKIWDKTKPIKAISKYFKVSEMVIKRRALDLGKISREEFFTYYNQYAKKELKKKTGRGGNFHFTTKKRLGTLYLHSIHNALTEGKLLYRDACKLTSLKGDTFQSLISKFSK